MTEFNVGDKVKIRATRSTPKWLVGREATISSVSETGGTFPYQIDVLDEDNQLRKGVGMAAQEMALIEPAKPKTALDQMVAEVDAKIHKAVDERAGVVKQLEESEKLVRVQRDKAKQLDAQIIEWGNVLVKLKAEPKVTPRVGDRVRITNPRSAHLNQTGQVMEAGRTSVRVKYLRNPLGGLAPEMYFAESEVEVVP